ncbi:hypothetical protein [Cellulomonas iranensis]|uniref:Uncharacterized protein n=1 Tax=Cellulomonas iranensis TaxID=76862 RepID=A0ABU0GLV1_9CELL|nr:hypothetical protein [Cellulomonas iranensis]MDQ0426023.1 hypothetical protein [Cellulomonas iranensis]
MNAARVGKCVAHESAERHAVGLGIPKEATSAVDSELRRADDQERQAVGGDGGPAPLVVEAALLSSVYAADREAFEFVEVGDGVIVLSLVDLDDQRKARPVRVDR